MRLNLSPSFAFDYGADGWPGNIKHSCYFVLVIFSACIKFSNFMDFCFAKLTQVIFGSIQRAMPTFGNHVSHVIFMGSNKQVLRPDTCGIVACMADAHIFRNITKMYFPAYSVRSDHFVTDAKVSIAVRTFASHPFITAMKWYKFNLVPESLFNFFGVNHNE